VVRLVLFDIDGTLIHTGGAGVKAFARALASQFQVHNGSEKIRFGGRTDTSLVRELFQYAGVPHTPENVNRFFDAYIFWLDHLMSEAHAGGHCPGVLNFIEAIQALPTPPVIGLLTGNIRLGAEIKLRRYALWDLFQTGGFGDDDEDRNRIAAVARERGSRLLGAPLRGSEILVVGDTHRDVACARAIDARMLAVATGPATVPELEAERPDWVVPTLEHAQAHTICG
jgi:phosphoglycolate phosphatase